MALMLFGSSTFAGVIYVSDYRHEATAKVYITRYKHEANCVVYETKYKHEGQKTGLWYFGKYKHKLCFGFDQLYYQI